MTLGAWECSWGLATCPRHGVTLGEWSRGQRFRRDHQSDPVCVPRTQPSPQALRAAACRFHNYWLFRQFLNGLQLCEDELQVIFHRQVSASPVRAGARGGRLSPHGCGERDSCSFPTASVSGAWRGSNNCDYSLTISVIQLTA